MISAAVLAGLCAALASLPLALCALVAARAFQRAAARYRVLAAVYAAIALLAPVVFAAAPLHPAPAASAPARALAANALAAPLFAAVVAVALFLCARLVFDVLAVLQVKRAAAVSERLPVRGARLAASARVTTPTAIGYLHPAVVVPHDFRTRVDSAEWQAVLAHELAHLSRRDDWAKALQSSVLRAGWWLPGLWLLSRALDLERELASDERAASVPGRRRYAACLLRLATDRCTGVAPALWGRRAHVAIRVERLLRPSPGAGPLVRAAALGALTATGVALAAAAILAVPGPARPSGNVARLPAARTSAVRPPVRDAAAAAMPRRRTAAKAHRAAAIVAWAAPPVAAAPVAPAPHPRRAAARLHPQQAPRPGPPLAPPPRSRWPAELDPSRSPYDADGSGVTPAASSAVVADHVEPGGSSAAASARAVLWIRLPAPTLP